ncbi:MAG: T9SS type A sorting domain-containing protein, partial [Bacteroidales bacterium]|nr:T9SS type A sorting domain-containing protein [Bacteroidales bacterium]
VVFNTKNVAFDMFVKNMAENDTLVVTIYTKVEYDSMKVIDPRMRAKAADSARFEATLEYGEYVAMFEIVRKSDKVGETVVADATISFSVKEESAIERNELAGVNVYPNPNAGTFNVAVPERARVEIFGLNGAKVMSREVNAGVESFSIDHSGIYFVRVMAGNKTAVKRVVVR